MTMAKHKMGAARIGFAAAALAAVSLPGAALLAQAPAGSEPADATRVGKGREIFANWGCTACHSLADAQARSDVGPALDGGHLTEAFITQRVANGQGAMPAFAGQLTDEEIADVAYYITHVAKK